MDVSTTRPKVAELAFQLLGRSVHPELFRIYKTQRIERDAYRVTLHITSDGHMITCTHADTTLCEVAASSLQQLPSGNRIMCQPLRGQNKDSIACDDDIRYEYEYDLQRVRSDMFWMIQKQLGESRKNHEMIQEFDASGRIAIGGLSFVHIETRLQSFHIQAIHTFPDDLALLKTESTFRFPNSKP
ncbi:MAG: DUF2617 family protein [Aureliella sp.]